MEIGGYWWFVMVLILMVILFMFNHFMIVDGFYDGVMMVDIQWQMVSSVIYQSQWKLNGQLRVWFPIYHGTTFLWLLV